MSQISIAYIGPKKIKRDTITGSRQVFPRFEPIKVEKEVGVMLLQYDVFVEEKHLEAMKTRQEAIQKAEAEKQAKLEAEKQQRFEDAQRTIEIDGDTVDLNKLTKAKLATLVESQELDIEPCGPRETQPDFATRVFKALTEKVGD
ncbi:hypothetical protein AB6E53_02290 [Vibrio breoganii]|uniref:Uncharacterized protein n=1 Tax=Vibrio breoganii TaxID=553239 RepID=A0AAP8MWQ4_9VIBR|nr:hypothetical protein [Vibrio breoganii]PMP10216.1 hypothetical protein BCS93_11110 [Vibrio breoganii]